MDLKISGLTPEMIKEALYKTHKARDYILDDIMLPVIPEPRKELSKYAPKMLSTIIPVDKIREVIGSGGRLSKRFVLNVMLKWILKKTAMFISAV